MPYPLSLTINLVNDSAQHSSGRRRSQASGVVRYVVAALIVRRAPTSEEAAHEVLICQRKADQPMSLKWEFPGGKIELGETSEAARGRHVDE